MTAESSSSRPPLPLILGLVAFIGALAYVVASSLSAREAAVYEPTPIEPAASPLATLTRDTVTIDARDPTAWVFFDFDRRSVVFVPDTSGWDLAFRRFSVIAAGAVADAGPGSFDEVVVPSEGFVETVFARDTINAAIDRWYVYSLLSHLLSPKPNVYVVRARDGRFAKIEFISYYCPGLTPGCVTFRYLYQPDGSRTFS